MKNIIICISFLLLSFNGFAQSQNIQPTYRDLNLNNSFLGTWLYNQAGQSFKLVITRKNRQKFDNETLVDIFQAQYDYIKQGRIQAKNIGTDSFQVTYGFQNTKKPNTFAGTILEGETLGTLTAELINQNELKISIKRRVFTSADLKNEFTIPTEMVLLRSK